MLVDVLNQIDSIVWGPWLLILLVGTGVFLSCRLGFLQVMKLPRALKLIFFARNKGDGDIDSFKALCTALAATVGTGNIVGVATAIKLGGPGALFWMWLAAFFGMATIYAEATLAQETRIVEKDGNVKGGPVYYITTAFKGKFGKFLAGFFAVAITLALGFFGHRGGAQPTHPALRQMPCRLVLRVFLAQFSRLQTVLAYRIVQPGLARQA